MSFRELTMMDVKEVLRRWQVRQSARRMDREGVVGRRTAARYLEAAKKLGLSLDSELTDEVVRALASEVQERPRPEPSEARRVLGLHRARIEPWLVPEPPPTLVRVRELLAREGTSIAYTTLRRYAHEELRFSGIPAAEFPERTPSALRSSARISGSRGPPPSISRTLPQWAHWNDPPHRNSSRHTA